MKIITAAFAGHVGAVLIAHTDAEAEGMYYLLKDASMNKDVNVQIHEGTDALGVVLNDVKSW